MKRTRDDRSRSGDDGTALVEFALVMVFLFTLFLGIIVLGYLLSFRQQVVQAAGEGARVGAVSGDPVNDAESAADQQVASTGFPCSNPGMTCVATIHDCGALIDTVATPDCITVVVAYDYDQYPFLPDIPLIDYILPDDIAAASTAQLNP